MADDVTFQSATLATIPDGSIVAADRILNVLYQRVKVVYGVDGVATDVSASSPLPVTGAISGTGTASNVSSLNTNQTILAANAARLGATIANDSTQILYLKLGSSSSSTSYTVQMAGSTSGGIAYYEVPFDYTGIITGTWASANGNARVTELTA